jgi:lipopolysaccharide/colanic/teichoic acid biosynthesis glycosyltransferase
VSIKAPSAAASAVAARHSETDPTDGVAHLVPPRPRPVTDAAIRAIDVAGAAVALVVLSPVLVIAALLVRLTSKGPALFRQDRYGRHETRFQVVKFRTMVIDQGAVIDLASVERLERQGVLSKSAGDPRVTRVGRWLRRTSIDELPQLWNVLRGDMGLVGPRPLLPFMLDPYPELRRIRCAVRPGLTGLWQVSAREDNTSALSMADEDLEYVATRSVRGDLQIIAQTIPAIVRGSGAV